MLGDLVWLLDDVEQVFGANTLDYVLRLTQGHIDYLSRLPKHIIIHIVQFLELCDIAMLAQVSKQFRRVTFIYCLLLVLSFMLVGA